MGVAVVNTSAEYARNMRASFGPWIARFRRPVSWTVEGRPGRWHPVVIWATESGQRKWLVAANYDIDEDEAKKLAANLYREALRLYDVAQLALQQRLLGEDDE